MPSNVSNGSAGNIHLRSILGLPPNSNVLRLFLQRLAKEACSSESSDYIPIDTDIKCYPDCLYMNYYSLGLSLMFIAEDGSKTVKAEHAQSEKLRLDSICVHNAMGPRPKSGTQPYSTYPALPIVLPLLDRLEGRPIKELLLTTESNGKDIVSCLGEPSRKGGGSGPLSGSIGIWYEWTKDGIMIEFGGDEARGPQAWEKGKDAKWKILTIFAPS